MTLAEALTERFHDLAAVAEREDGAEDFQRLAVELLGELLVALRLLRQMGAAHAAWMQGQHSIGARWN